MKGSSVAYRSSYTLSLTDIPVYTPGDRPLYPRLQINILGNSVTIKYHNKAILVVVFWKDAHFFLNAQFKVRKLTFLRLYPTNFHKTKCIAYANMSTFHKQTACLNPSCSICKHSKQMCEHFQHFRRENYICFECLQIQNTLNMTTLYVYE